MPLMMAATDAALLTPLLSPRFFAAVSPPALPARYARFIMRSGRRSSFCLICAATRYNMLFFFRLC